MDFGMIDKSQYKKWQLLFARSLVANLKLIQEYEG
jgi:hypothetical protein